MEFAFTSSLALQKKHFFTHHVSPSIQAFGLHNNPTFEDGKKVYPNSIPASHSA